MANSEVLYRKYLTVFNIKTKGLEGSESKMSSKKKKLVLGK